MSNRRSLQAIGVAALLMMSSVRALGVTGQAAASAIDRNVVYGMFSGLALLMDVHRPDKPNGIGIVAIIGTGFHSRTTYDAPQMKDQPYQTRVFVDPLVAAGYTVFVINHRATPTFRHPAALQDAERAVRFIRHHAARFAISADRIGAVGASSGGYLASMLGVGSGDDDSVGGDEVNRRSARVQAVVAFCALEDLTAGLGAYAMSAVAAYVGSVRPLDPKSPEWRLYREASPINSVTADDAPALLIHGDKDTEVPLEHSEKMEIALKGANVATKLVRVPGAGHTMIPNPEKVDYASEMVRWFDAHLRSR